MRCTQHWEALHTRLKAEATGTTPGQWTCTVCHHIPQPLIDYGHVEFSDRRETAPFRILPRLTPKQLVATIESQREAVAAAKRKNSSGLGTSQSERAADKEEDLDVAPGQSPADIPTIEAGTPSASVALEPKPAPKRVAMDASKVDLDDPSSWGAPPKPRAKPKPKPKATPKPRSKAKKDPPQSEGLF